MGITLQKVVFIDETYCKTNMIPRFGWGSRGEKIVDASPFGHWLTVSHIRAIRYRKTFAPLTFTGGTTHAKFLEYVETTLLPALSWGDLVVMDNLSAHKQINVQEFYHVNAVICFLYRSILSGF